MSFKCLEDNSYDRNSCGEYFENYKRCKDFWVSLSVFVFPSWISEQEDFKQVQCLSISENVSRSTVQNNKSDGGDRDEELNYTFHIIQNLNRMILLPLFCHCFFACMASFLCT